VGGLPGWEAIADGRRHRRRSLDSAVSCRRRQKNRRTRRPRLACRRIFRSVRARLKLCLQLAEDPFSYTHLRAAPGPERFVGLLTGNGCGSRKGPRCARSPARAARRLRSEMIWAPGTFSPARPTDRWRGPKVTACTCYPPMENRIAYCFESEASATLDNSAKEARCCIRESHRTQPPRPFDCGCQLRSHSPGVEFDLNPADSISGFSVHPDGKRVLLVSGGLRYDLWMAEGFAQPATGWKSWFRHWEIPPAPARTAGQEAQ